MVPVSALQAKAARPAPWLDTIIKGDCVAALENLPDHSVDAIFADPGPVDPTPIHDLLAGTGH